MTSRNLVLSGFLLALLGAILPTWNYRVTEQHAAAGWLFFALTLGVAAGGELVRRCPPNRFIPLAGCALAAVSLLALGTIAAPLRFAFQFAGWFTVGFAAGLIGTVGTAFLPTSGLYFTAGCFASAVSVATALHFGLAAQLLPILAIPPALVGLFSVKSKSSPLRTEGTGQFSTPGALIFAALLLVQSGSEWTVAGWLPLFLTHRTGISPETSLWMLALYWFTLLLGRIANFHLLAHVRHVRILFSSASAALLGCLLLVATDNILGATVAILLLALGFAAVYPLLAEKMGSRPGVFNAIFSLALTGGLLFPWFAGLLAQSVSLTAIVAIPAIGIVLVVALLLVLWLESKVTGR